MSYHDSRTSTDEEAPLLPSAVPPTSSETLTEEERNNASNQSVTPLRALCIIGSLGLLIFLQACNISLVTTTQSTIAADLDAFTQVSWFTSAYLIPMASLSPLAGRLSQTFSPRNCIFVSTIIFSIGVFVTSRAIGLPLFLTGRAITGVGAAGIIPLCIILVIEMSSKRRRGLFIGLVNSGTTIGVSLGAVIAGAIVGPFGWRPIFWMQTPLVVAAGICIFFSIPKSFTTNVVGMDKHTLRHKLARIDYAGAILLTSSLVILLTSLSSPQISPLPVLLSLFLFLLFVLNEIYLASAPVIPITVLRSRGVLFTCIAQLLLMMARWTVLFYTPVYAIAIRSWAPTAAGSILIPTNAGFALGGLLAGWIHIRRAGSFYIACLAVFALFPLTLLLLASLSVPDTPVAWYLLAPFLNGLVTGAALNYTLAHLLHLTAPTTHFIATSLITTFRGFAGSFGSALGGSIFTRILQASLQQGFAGLDNGDNGGGGGSGRSGRQEDLIRRLLGSPALVASLKGAEREVAVQAYVDAIRGLFGVAAALGLLALAVQAGTGWRMGEEEEEKKKEGEGVDEEVGTEGANADADANRRDGGVRNDGQGRD